MKRNETIDTLKLIGAICIIGIHTQVFKDFNMTIYNLTGNGLFRFAVPFFFITSGYFFYERIQNNKETKSYYKNLIKIFIIFECIELIIYTPFFLNTVKENPIAYFWVAISAGRGGAYWYLFSLIITLLIVTPLWKKKKILPGMIVGCILNLLSMTNDTYSFLFEGTMIQNIVKMHQIVFTWPQAGLCMSLLYLSLGAYIKEHDIKIKTNKMIFVGTVLLLGESYFCQSHNAVDANSYLSLYLLVPKVFVYALQHPVCKFYKKGFNKIALYIYMVHPILNNCIGYITTGNKEIQFLLVTIFSVVIAYIISKKKGFLIQ